jgi:hypothetical protein
MEVRSRPLAKVAVSSVRPRRLKVRYRPNPVNEPSQLSDSCAPGADFDHCIPKRQSSCRNGRRACRVRPEGVTVSGVSLETVGYQPRKWDRSRGGRRRLPHARHLAHNGATPPFFNKRAATRNRSGMSSRSSLRRNITPMRSSAVNSSAGPEASTSGKGGM